MHNFAFGIYFVVDLVSSNEFDTTVTELKAMAAPAIMGDRTPKAASGIINTL